MEKVPKKKYKVFKKNHLLREWEDTGEVVEHDYDYEVKSSKEYKYVPINQGLDFSDSEINQSVITIPKINESNAIKRFWYNSALFKYLIWPILAGLLIIMLANLIL